MGQRGQIARRGKRGNDCTGGGGALPLLPNSFIPPVIVFFKHYGPAVTLGVRGLGSWDLIIDYSDKIDRIEGF